MLEIGLWLRLFGWDLGCVLLSVQEQISFGASQCRKDCEIPGRCNKASLSDSPSKTLLSDCEILSSFQRASPAGDVLPSAYSSPGLTNKLGGTGTGEGDLCEGSEIYGCRSMLLAFSSSTPGSLRDFEADITF
jgi:hypothetical protein